ncbi:Uncharacterised protein [Pantoea agglomerans]|uniref:Diguanylate cyclase n=1 Tax=Enterobacter agglomerans TaxID=549 RepID=A0A379AL68_ENTAG|nr:Uncharacterised protein [Pantoea agglomerans]
MKLQSYEELKQSKYRLSVMLFLFLNIAVSLFHLLPIMNSEQSETTLPVMSVAAFSGIMLIALLIWPKVKLPLLNPVALLLGMLWAWHINYRFHQVFYFDGGFLIISLISVLFISAIALSDYLGAFCLHVTPPVLTVLLLDNAQHLPLILLTITLPLIGFFTTASDAPPCRQLYSAPDASALRRERDIQRPQHARPADRAL